MAGLLLSLCGAPDGRMRSAHARSKRPDLMRARKVSTVCPPGMRHRMPERFSLCVTRVLQAASTDRCDNTHRKGARLTVRYRYHPHFGETVELLRRD